MDRGMGEATAAAVIDRHGIDADRGFLPNRDPLERFPRDAHDPTLDDYLRGMDLLGADLPALLADGTFREAATDLSPPPAGAIDALTDREVIRLCKLSAFFASGYVHQRDAEPAKRLPAGIARPLYRTSQRLQRRPILAYDLLVLHNFRRRGSGTDAFDPEHLEAIQQFTTLDDERWFTVIHAAIEAEAGTALRACVDAHRAVRADRPDRLREALDRVADSLAAQSAYMGRMTEGNDPEAFAFEFRPYYEGFDGVVFEGVDDLGGEPQTLRGGSGAQSSAIPAIDAALGIDHDATDLIDKLADMRSYMPAHHREIIEAYRAGPDVGPYVDRTGDQALVESYNRCLDGLVAFREVHFQQVAQYIRRLTDDLTGTGGTNYMRFLPTLTEETVERKLE